MRSLPWRKRIFAGNGRQKPSGEQAAARPRDDFFLPFAVNLNALLLCGGIAAILRAKLGKTRLATALVGTNQIFLGLTEAMTDFGLDCSFFEGDPADIFHPIRPSDELSQCDVALVADHDPVREKELLEKMRRTASLPTVAIGQLLAAHLAVLNGEPSVNRTCLNPHKLSMIAAALALTNPQGCVVECGVYMGGTTVYMALLQRALGIRRKIYALDTFEGMPAPTERDFGGDFVYTSGMFTENRIDIIRNLIVEADVANDIAHVAGLCQDTLPSVFEECGRVAFTFLDTDQYAGTKGGLDHIAPHLLNDSLIIVDDSTVHGVRAAIDEAISGNSILYQAPLCTNFEAVFSRRLAAAEPA